jgi:hypothetical protein
MYASCFDVPLCLVAAPNPIVSDMSASYWPFLLPFGVE